MMTIEQHTENRAKALAVAASVYRALKRYDDEMTDSQRVEIAKELRSILRDAQIVDAFAFNDLIWGYLPEAYADVELNQTFLETW